jgi:Transposase DDE domain
MMRRGYSRDHRPDCEQLVLAWIVNQDGFPLSYEVFDGNRADVTTIEATLRTVERKHGKARRVWIFDRGVMSEENLVAIPKRGGEYLVGTTRSKLKQVEAELLKDDFEKIRPKVEVSRSRFQLVRRLTSCVVPWGGRRKRFTAALWPRSKKLLPDCRNLSATGTKANTSTSERRWRDFNPMVSFSTPAPSRFN